MDFIEVGTADFKAECLINKGVGLAIEPIKEYLDNLPNTVSKLQAAISDKQGLTPIYHLPPEKIEKYHLPYYLRGCNSINHIHPLVKRNLLAKNLPLNLVEVTYVPCYTLLTIFQSYKVESLNYLKLDCEGHDCIILNHFLTHTTVFPRRIQFETNSLTPSPFSTYKLAKEKGYLVEEGYNTILTRPHK